MKTEFMYVCFKVTDSAKVKKDWDCYCKATNKFMGTLLFFPEDKQYLYFPQDETDFSIMHYENISEFMYQLNNQ